MTTPVKHLVTHLSATAPDLPQTVQLEQFSDLVAGLFHTANVAILCCEPSQSFVITAASCESADWAISIAHQLVAGSARPAFADVQLPDTQLFVIATHCGVQYVLALGLVEISAEQMTALQWLIDCIASYLLTHPFEAVVSALAVTTQLSADNCNSVFTWQGATVHWCVGERCHQLSPVALQQLLGFDAVGWMQSFKEYAELIISQTQPIALNLQLKGWRLAAQHWVLQVQEISTALQLRQTRHQLSFLQNLFDSGVAALIGLNQQQQVVYANQPARELLQIYQNQSHLSAPLDINYLQFFERTQQQTAPITAADALQLHNLERREGHWLVQYPAGEVRAISTWVVPHHHLMTLDIASYCLMMDVTAEYQLQQALGDMQQHIDSLLHFSPVAIYQSFLDLRDGFIYISPNIEKIAGVSSADIVNAPHFWQAHVHPDDQHLLRFAAKQPEPAYEYRIYNPQRQRYLWVKDIRNVSIEGDSEHCVFGALLDIDARKNAELEQHRLRMELDDHKQELSQSLDSLVDAVITFNETLNLLSWNPACKQLFGYSDDELTELTFDTLIGASADVRETLAALHRHAMPDAQRLEITTLSNHGQRIHFSCTIAKLPSSALQSARFVACLHDLTDLKQQQDQLIQAEKLSALGTLTSGIAHDFNNILGIIRGYAEMLMLRSEQPTQGYAENIVKAADRASAMTKNLLAFSSNKSQERVTLELNRCLDELNDMLSEALPAHVRLQIQRWPQALNVSVEPGGLENALLNLVINASHAIRQQGDIVIRIQPVQLDRTQAKALDVIAGNYGCIVVKDTGEGMSEQVKHRLFEPFFTTKGAKGNGLGLAQVFGFCRRSQGAVSVQSVLGQGSEFTIFLPLRTSVLPIADNAKTADNSMTAVAAKNKSLKSTILLVDDELALLTVHTMLLETMGYQVLAVDNLQAAMAILKSQPVALVLSDIVMPEGSGFDLVEFMLREKPGLPIQLVSGFADDSQIINPLVRPYFEQRLQKPLNTAALLARIEKLLN